MKILMDLPDHAASIVHDVKNRLQLLDPKLETLIGNESADVSRLGVDVQQALAEVNHQLVLLLGLYRLDQTEVISMRETYLRDMLESVSSRVEGCELLCSDELTAFCDERLVTAVVGDALHNAKRYAKSRVRLSAVATNKCVRISVEDDGTGLVDTGTDESNLGLGMLLAEKVAAAHRNGLLRGRAELIRSVELGGARFDLFIP